jgi:hypothetical protein
MSKLTDYIVRICAENTLRTMRSHPYLQWAPEAYLLPGIQMAWIRPFAPGSCSSTLTAAQLDKSLAAAGVPAAAIKRYGKLRTVELENIAFAYRDKRTRDGGYKLMISPYIPGNGECRQTFVNPTGPADTLAAYMLTIDSCVPAARAACLEAYQIGLRERKVREIRRVAYECRRTPADN